MAKNPSVSSENSEKINNQVAQELAKIVGNGITQLMFLFAFNQSKKLPQALSQLETLPLNTLAELCGQTDNTRNNVLMFAAAFAAEHFEQLLSIIQKLPTPQLLSILMQRNDEGETLFMIAARKNPQLIPKILQALEKLPLANQATFLKQVDHIPPCSFINIGNLLMWIITFADPTLVAPAEIWTLFSRIFNRLSNDDKETILKQINHTGENALILAVKYNRAYVSSILQLANSINNPVLMTRLLMQKDNLDCNEQTSGFVRRTALQNAEFARAKNNSIPSPILSLFVATFQLPLNLRNDIIRDLKDSDWINLVNSVKTDAEELQLIRLLMKFVPDKLKFCTEAGTRSIVKRAILLENKKENDALPTTLKPSTATYRSPLIRSASQQNRYGLFNYCNAPAKIVEHKITRSATERDFEQYNLLG